MNPIMRDPHRQMVILYAVIDANQLALIVTTVRCLRNVLLVYRR